MSSSQPKKIKIMRLITRMNIGGPAIHVSVLSQNIDELNNIPVENHLVYGELEDGEGDMSDLVDVQKVKTHVIAQLKQQVRLKDDLIAFFKIFFLMCKVRPQIVHTHTAKAGILGRAAAILTFRPIIIHTYHGHSFSGYFSPSFEKTFRLIDRVLNYFSTRVISISKKLTSELCQTHHVVDPNKVSEISLGLPLKKFFDCPLTKSEVRTLHHLAQDKIIYGCVGRMVEIKNHLTLLKAWKNQSLEFQQKNLLVFIGDGPLGESLKKFVLDNQLKESVMFISWIRNLETYYRSFDYFILPSLNEGTPVTILEAMASQVPILASCVGGIPDLLGPIQKEEQRLFLCERGIGFAPTEEFLSRLLVWVGQNSQLPKQCVPAASEFAKNFLEERLVSDVKDLYEQLI